MKNFDDLFNKFFGRDKKEEEFINKEAKKIIDMINNFKHINPNGNYTGEELNKLDEELDTKLGEPDDIEYSSDGEMYFEKRMWYKPLGVIIKTLVSDEPFQTINLKPDLPLNEQLEIAVNEENYELAAELRDKIKKAVAKEKRRVKKLNT